MAPEDLNRTKASLLRKALSEHPVVSVYLDGTHKGCIIPQPLRSKDSVLFELGYNMPVPIPDLAVTDACVQGTLSFGGLKSFVSVPLEAVWGVSIPGKGDALFASDAPARVRAQLEAQIAGEAPPAAPAAREGAKVLSMDEASRRLRGRPLRRGTGSGVFPTRPGA